MVKKRGYIAPSSLLKRFVAFVIDLFIINLILFPLNTVFSDLVPRGKSFLDIFQYLQSPAAQNLIFQMSVVSGLITIIYFTWFEFRLQQTPGKMLFRIFAVPEGKSSFWNYLLSNVIFLTFIPLIGLLWIVDVVHLFFSPKKQRLLEKLSHILVVQKFRG